MVLFDPRLRHQKITHWHKLARGEPASRFEVPFVELAGRFAFEFVQKQIDISAIAHDPASLAGGPWDAIVLAHGAVAPPCPPGAVSLDVLRNDAGQQRRIGQLKNSQVAVIGGGPTGVQFAFELQSRGNQVAIFEARDRLLPLFDLSLGQMATQAAQEIGINVFTQTTFATCQDGHVVARNGSREFVYKADYVLFVPGVRAVPEFSCDLYGRMPPRGGVRLYAAGDNSHFSGPGLNSKSAQAAVRKGMHVARVLAADLLQKPAPEYRYQALGYFISLGAKNAVGYLFSEKASFCGRAAALLKEAVEQQYDLFLQGLPVFG